MLHANDVRKKMQYFHSMHDKHKDWHHIPHNCTEYAAVLVMLTEIEGVWHCVFIQRAENPRDPHTGQVAFPGGRVESHDADFIATALRETREEIGVSVARSDIVALLPYVRSRSGYSVRPVIGLIAWPQALVLQTREVQSVFTIPLIWLANMHNRDSASFVGLPENATIVYKPYQDKRLWGLSAAIVDQILTIIEVYI